MITFSNLGNYGRLGNQLFQIAATIAYAKRYNQEYCFPRFPYYDFFNCSFKIQNVDVNTVLREYSEVDYSPIPGYFPQMGNVDLFGYFQSELYFKDAKEEVLKVLKTEFQKIPYGFIHIRHGDYLNLPNHHPTQSIEYYLKGMDELGFSQYLCFSDDIPWCKKNLKDSRITFVEGTNEIQDLRLMSKCEGAVIANSSFSWWAAYLSESSKVIIPRNWFGPAFGNYAIEHRLVDGWKAI